MTVLNTLPCPFGNYGQKIVFKTIITAVALTLVSATSVSFEDRQDLPGHKSQRITTHYSAPDIKRLMFAAEKVVKMRLGPSLRLVGNQIYHRARHFCPTTGASALCYLTDSLQIIPDTWFTH